MTVVAEVVVDVDVRLEYGELRVAVKAHHYTMPYWVWVAVSDWVTYEYGTELLHVEWSCIRLDDFEYVVCTIMPALRVDHHLACDDVSCVYVM